MRLPLASLLFVLSSHTACAEAPVNLSDTKMAGVIFEFEKFMELELRDCIAGYDSVLYQEKTNPDTVLNIGETEEILAVMQTALNNKVGENVSMEVIRETSSWHISGIYLNSEGGDTQSNAHLVYQEKILESCNRQIGRIANQVSESEGL